MAQYCDSKIQCFVCKGRHHMAVCDSGNSCVSANSAMEDACNLPEMSTPVMHVSSGMHVLLQTAQVVVSRPGMESSHSLQVRAIFDTGAQRSCFPGSCECTETGDCQDRHYGLQHLVARTAVAST